MIGLSRSVVALLLAIVTVHFSGSALAEPMSDRAFFVRWTDSGNNKELLGVHFADARTGWVVGRGGRIVATRDGGSSWAAQQSGTGQVLRGVHFADARTGWAVGDDGAIVATRDGGASWAAQQSGTGKVLWGVHFADARTGWAVGDEGTTVATGDGGASWAPQSGILDAGPAPDGGERFAAAGERPEGTGTGDRFPQRNPR